MPWGDRFSHHPPVRTILMSTHSVRNNPSHPGTSESCIKIKINLNFYFHTFWWCLKGFMKDFKPFIKPFEAPQGSVKSKI